MSLSTSDVEGLEETLAAGKHPKVVFTDAAGQISGKVGKVVRLTRPAEGDFVVVAFGNDELPFTADEIRVPARGELNRKPAKKKTAPAPQPVAVAAGAPLLDQMPATAGVGGDNGTGSARQLKETKSMNDPQATVPQQSDGSAEAAAAPAPKKRAAKAKSAPELTVTLAWKDDEWSVSAAKGTKVIAKPVPVKASMAVSMVQSLDSPAVAAVVEDIVEQQRHQVEQTAERLRAELAAAEARLAELAQ